MERGSDPKKKLVKEAQLKPLKAPSDFGLKPYKYPGDPDPVQPETKCRFCGSDLNENEKICHNCDKTDIAKGQPIQRKPADRGKQKNPFSTNIDRFINPSIPLFNNLRAAQSMDKIKKNKKEKDRAEHSKDTVKDVFVSEPAKMCADPRLKKRRNDDIRKEEIMRSCEDLAIDG